MTTVIITVSVLGGLCSFFSFWYGRRTGVQQERDRVGKLHHASMNTRHSGTLNWVMEAVREGKELTEYTTFFGTCRPDPVIALLIDVKNIVRNHLIPQDEVYRMVDEAYVAEIMHS